MKISVRALLVSALLIAATAVADEIVPAPGFALPDLTQKEVQLESYKGKVVYLDFWASWCVPCRKTFPWMNEMQKKYSAEGLEIIAVSVDKNRAEAEKFLAKYPAEFGILHDGERKVTKLYKVKGVPTSYLIDREGNIRSATLGTSPEHFAELETKIKQLLGPSN